MLVQSKKYCPKYFETELEWLIHHLWVKPAVFAFRIPDTVVLKNGEICNWYFNAHSGCILKKNKSSLQMLNVQEKILGKLNANFEHVAATAYHFEKSRTRSRPDTLTLEYISTHDFRGFADTLDKCLRSQDPQFKVPSILQKFVYSKSSKNQVLKCEWSCNENPGGEPTCFVERAFNIHSMYDPKVELSDRIHTFEASKEGVNCCVLDSSVPDILHMGLSDTIS